MTYISAIEVTPGVIMRQGIGLDGPWTVVVVGTARGGTSCVAEKLVELGVHIGDEYGTGSPMRDTSKRNRAFDYENYEDKELAEAIDEVHYRGKTNDYASNEWRYVRQLIQDRNVLRQQWGFKKPQVTYVIDQLLPSLRNPHIVVVLRDPIAIWTGDRRREGTHHWYSVRHSVSCVMDLIEKPRGPTLALSYERCKERPLATKKLLAKFLGLTIPTEEKLNGNCKDTTDRLGMGTGDASLVLPTADA